MQVHPTTADNLLGPAWMAALAFQRRDQDALIYWLRQLAGVRQHVPVGTNQDLVLTAFLVRDEEALGNAMRALSAELGAINVIPPEEEPDPEPDHEPDRPDERKSAVATVEWALSVLKANAVTVARHEATLELGDDTLTEDLKNSTLGALRDTLARSVAAKRAIRNALGHGVNETIRALCAQLEAMARLATLEEAFPLAGDNESAVADLENRAAELERELLLAARREDGLL